MNVQRIYGSLYKLSLPKKVSLQSIQPSKKINIWKTKSSTPPPSMTMSKWSRNIDPKGKMVREYMAPFINFVYLKSAFIKHPTSVKKENFWMTHSSPPPLPMNMGNGQKISAQKGKWSGNIWLSV